MASHIPLVEDDHVIGIDGKPLAPLPVNAWSGLPFEVHPHMRKGEVAHRYNPHALLLVHQRSRGRALIRSGLTVYDLRLEPGHVDVFSTGFRMDHASWDCTPGEVLAIEVDPGRARAYLHDDVALDPTTRLATRDPVIERLSACMRSEVDAGCPSGTLFAEGLSLALLARLGACYGAHEARHRPARKLAPRQLQDTIEYIDTHIGEDLSVTALARRLDLSPYTFAKLFKAAVDLPPHSFVLSRRLRRAELLLASELSLSEIALAVGFASQSHFTEAFRRRTGRTPAQARRR
jgi:AraC family transcriptional regulator